MSSAQPYDTKAALTDALPWVMLPGKTAAYKEEIKKNLFYPQLMWKALEVARFPNYNLYSSGKCAIMMPIQIVLSTYSIAISIFRFIVGQAFWEDSQEPLSKRIFTWLRDLVNIAIKPLMFIAYEIALFVGLINLDEGKRLLAKIDFCELHSREKLASTISEGVKCRDPSLSSPECQKGWYYIRDHFGWLRDDVSNAYNSGVRDIDALIPYLGTDLIADRQQTVLSILARAEKGEDLSAILPEKKVLAFRAALVQENVNALKALSRILSREDSALHIAAKEYDKLLLMAALITGRLPSEITPLEITVDDVVIELPGRKLIIEDVARCFGEQQDSLTEEYMGPLLLNLLDECARRSRLLLSQLVFFSQDNIDVLVAAVLGKAHHLAAFLFSRLDPGASTNCNPFLWLQAMNALSQITTEPLDILSALQRIDRHFKDQEREEAYA